MIADATATTQEQRNLATARALYAATGSGDWDAAENLLSDDLIITEADTLPYAGTYRGKGALRELYRRALAVLGGAVIQMKGQAAGGSVVVYLMELQLPWGGAPIELAEVLHLDADGKVVEIKPYYFDSDAVRNAAGRSRSL